MTNSQSDIHSHHRLAVQATLLAQQDAITPLVAVATQCALNIGGDWLLVVRNGGGLAGAAWATVASQVCASCTADVQPL